MIDDVLSHLKAVAAARLRQWRRVRDVPDRESTPDAKDEAEIAWRLAEVAAMREEAGK